ncbi:MAG: hypothetical protein VXZ39_01870 [Planctomycetota bacterium]|nr:hypothetical protein [Planctomycetota bacterium]
MKPTAPTTSLFGLPLALALLGCGAAAEPETSSTGADLDGPVATPASSAGIDESAARPGPTIAPLAESPGGEPAAELPDGWRRYEDPVSGGSFAHPRDWIVRPAQGALVLLPDDHREDRELITVTAVDARGARDPRSPEVGAALDAVVGASFPSLTRRSGPEDVDGLSFDAASYEYRGRVSADRIGRCIVYVTIADGRAAALSLVADRTSFRRRRADVEAIFATFRARRAEAPTAPGGEPALELDPRLVGMFRGEAVASAAETVVNTQLVYALGADGVVLLGARSNISASERDAAGTLEWTASDATGSDFQRGRWSSRGGVLRIEWSGGGMSAFKYRFEPDGTLALRELLTGELVDIYTRVQ